MKGALPQAQVEIMRNSSHMPFYENPQDYYRVLLGFLSRCGGNG
jgi:proline iminopeptidase